MATILEDKGREFKRIRHSAQEKVQLSRAGFQHVLSSNVSAIAKDGDNLVVRFHGGATYEYTGAGDLYSKMLRSNSKGKFVWRELIRKRVPFRKVGSVRLRSDAQYTDRDLMRVADRPRERQSIIPTIVVTTILKDVLATNDVVNIMLATNATS